MKNQVQKQTANSLLSSEANAYVDAAELYMVENMVGGGQFQFIDCPLKHTFTKGLYSRRITMPAGSVLTSKIHKTQHQFAVLKGSVTVRTFVKDGFFDVRYKAGDSGITEPGTRRILIIGQKKDCIWITFHPTDKTTPEEVEADIIEPHQNKLLEEFVNKELNNIK